MDKPKWTKDEIDKTVEILSRAKEKKTGLVRFLDEVVYISAFVVAVLINFALSIALVPVMIAFYGIWLYLVIAMLALTFGVLFEALMRDIEALQFRHHVINTLIVPGIAVINLIIIGTVANLYEEALMVNNVPHHPLVEGVVYAIFFILPYVYHHFYKKRSFI